MAREEHWLGLHQHQWKVQLQHGRKAHRVLQNQALVKMVKLVRGLFTNDVQLDTNSQIDVICDQPLEKLSFLKKHF